MKGKTSRRILAMLFALVMCLSLSATAFAAEIPVNDKVAENVVMTSMENTTETQNERSVTSSINGYARKTITASDSYIAIECNGVGLGGMGVTIKTSSSSGGSMSYYGETNEGLGVTSDISGTIACNGGNKEHHNLWHDDIGYYYIFFSDIPAGASIDVQVWIYG